MRDQLEDPVVFLNIFYQPFMLVGPPCPKDRQYFLFIANYSISSFVWWLTVDEQHYVSLWKILLGFLSNVV